MSNDETRTMNTRLWKETWYVAERHPCLGQTMCSILIADVDYVHSNTSDITVTEENVLLSGWRPLTSVMLLVVAGICCSLFAGCRPVSDAPGGTSDSHPSALRSYSSAQIKDATLSASGIVTGNLIKCKYGSFYADYGKTQNARYVFYRPIVMTFVRDPKGITYDPPDYDDMIFTVRFDSGKAVTMERGVVMLLNPYSEKSAKVADEWDIRLVENEDWLNWEDKESLMKYFEMLLDNFCLKEPGLAREIGLIGKTDQPASSPSLPKPVATPTVIRKTPPPFRFWPD